MFDSWKLTHLQYIATGFLKNLVQNVTLMTSPIYQLHHLSGCVSFDSLSQLLLCISTELQQSHEHCRHIHVGLPHSEATTNQIDGSAPNGAVGR